MDEIQAAAMWLDEGVNDLQSKKIIQHLRANLGANIAVPSSRIRKLRGGYTKPRAGSINFEQAEG